MERIACVGPKPGPGNSIKWADKSTTSYDMLDIKSYINSLTRKYLVIGRHMLQIQGILLQYLKFN